MSTSDDRIVALCDELATKLDDAVTRAGGGLIVDFDLEQFRLRNNGICWPDLSYGELQTACAALLRVGVLRNGYSIVDQDHLYLWSWIAQLLHAHPPEVTEPIAAHDTLCLAVRAALAPVRLSGLDQNTQELFNLVDRLIPYHLRELRTHSSEILTYLAFPALEAALRLACGDFVDSKGFVLAPFASVGGRSYAPGNRCSNLRDLLLLLYDRVAPSDLRDMLTRIRVHLSTLDSTTDPFELVFAWRNSTLHGERQLSTVSATVLTIGLLVGLHTIESDFGARQSRARKIADWEIGRGLYGRSYGFFPPA